VPILYTLLIRDRRRVAHDIDVELSAHHDEAHGVVGSVGQVAHRG